jgi:catechol 2,3-dioxygenase-like lactoylglutathione lyase family enzyme
MTFGISHFAIKVRDLVAAERFYCGVLGMRIERRWPDAGGTGIRSVWVRTGDDAGTFLALEALATGQATVPPAAAANGEQQGHHLLALRIRLDQRASFEARLAAAGVKVSHRTVFTMYFADPEGNRLGLSHYPEPSDLPDPSDPTIPPASPNAGEPR